MSEHAVTVLISRSVKLGCEADFERVAATMMEAAKNFKGCLGAQLVYPGEDPDVADPMSTFCCSATNEKHAVSVKH